MNDLEIILLHIAALRKQLHVRTARRTAVAAARCRFRTPAHFNEAENELSPLSILFLDILK